MARLHSKQGERNMNKDELLQEIKLRRFIRQAIKLRQQKMNRTKQRDVIEEQKLRTIIRHLLIEAETDTDTEPVPYKSTAMNLINDVFGEILPVVKKGLRKLTSDPEERVSYLDHILNKIKNMFDVLNASQEAGQALAEQRIGIKIEDDDEEEVGETPDFDDPDAPAEEKPTKEDEEETEFQKFAIAGKDETGARIAFDTIAGSNIEDNIRKLVRLLGDDEKRKEAQEYFLYNLNLFAIGYEKDLASEIGQEPAFTEPTMPKPAGAQVSPEAEGGGMGEEEPLGDELEAPPELPGI
jgi:hypothetical protein